MIKAYVVIIISHLGLQIIEKTNKKKDYNKDESADLFKSKKLIRLSAN